MPRISLYKILVSALDAVLPLLVVLPHFDAPRRSHARFTSRRRTALATPLVYHAYHGSHQRPLRFARIRGYLPLRPPPVTGETLAEELFCRAIVYARNACWPRSTLLRTIPSLLPVIALFKAHTGSTNEATRQHMHA